MKTADLIKSNLIEGCFLFEAIKQHTDGNSSFRRRVGPLAAIPSISRQIACRSSLAVTLVRRSLEESASSTILGSNESDDENVSKLLSLAS
jgi:hypothetical protein